MKKDYKFIKNRIRVAQIQALASLILGIMVLFFGFYVISSLEKQIEIIIGILVMIGLLGLSGFACYSNLVAIKKYNAFLEDETNENE